MKSSATEIAYEVVRSRRKTADIVIEWDGSVLVRAPEEVAPERIEDIIESKRHWIYRNLAEWRDLNATRVVREYRNGEGFLYLGRSYRLLLVADQEQPLLLKNGRFCLLRDLGDRGEIPVCPGRLSRLLHRPGSGATDPAGSILRAQGRSRSPPSRCP